MERGPTLLLGAAENPFGKVWYTPLPTKKREKKGGGGGICQAILCLCACGSCQGVNLGLPVSFYRDIQEGSCYPLSFSHLRRFPPWVQIMELILGNLWFEFLLSFFWAYWCDTMEYRYEILLWGEWGRAAPCGTAAQSPHTAVAREQFSRDQRAPFLGSLPAPLCLCLCLLWERATTDAASLLLL